MGGVQVVKADGRQRLQNVGKYTLAAAELKQDSVKILY